MVPVEDCSSAPLVSDKKEKNICSRDGSVGNGKNFEKQAQSSKG